MQYHMFVCFRIRKTPGNVCERVLFLVTVTVNQLDIVCEKSAVLARSLHQNCQSTRYSSVLLKKRDKFSCEWECSLLKTAAVVFHSCSI
uniref:Uncharacterized protein n=1 Tax=Anguilla anguilla TaxID=7936 RepID=A0A0E9X4J2_ANGAN